MQLDPDRPPLSFRVGIAAAVASALLAAVLAWTWNRPGARPAPSPERAAINPETDASAPESDPGRAPAMAPATGERAPAPPPAPNESTEPSEARLLVRVLDENGQGVAGAWVHWQSGETSGELEADADGLAWVARSELADRTARVQAGADGFYPIEATIDLPWLPKSEAREMRLPAATELEGVVLDADTRLPIEGVAVGFSAQLAPWLHPTEWTHSDAQGRFWFDPVPASTRIVLTTATPAYAPTRVVTLAHPAPETLLERGEAITVRVTDIESGRPIAGARFACAGPGQQGDADGVLRARGLREPGQPFIDLEVGAPGYSPVRFTYVPGADEPLEVPLVRSTSVLGQVVDSRGLPVEGASVTIESRSLGVTGGCHVRILRLGAARVELLADFPEEWRIGSEDPDCSARTDGDGRFRIDGLRPISFEATALVQAPGYVTARQPIGALGPPGGSMEVRIELARGGQISGVLRLNGEPVPGRVTWETGPLGFVEADMEGCFTLSGIPEGRVTLKAVPRKYENSAIRFAEAVAIDLAAGEVRESVVLDLSLDVDTIAGRVLDAHGAGIQGAFVSAFNMALRDAYRGTTDEAGKFELEVPASRGAFSVTARFAKEEQSIEDAPPGSRDLLFRLGSSGRLRVRARERGTSACLPAFEIAWRLAGQGDYERTSALHGPRDGEGFVSIDLPAVPADLVLVDWDQRFAPRYLFDVPIPDGGELAIDEELDEAIPVVFLLEGPGARPAMELWLFEEHLADELAELDLSSEGYKHLMWLPEFQGRRLVFDSGNRATVRGVGPGRFKILCQEASLHVDPEWLDVVAGNSAPIVLNLSER